jgi:SRSO17 transposase
MPKSRCDDTERRTEAGIPDLVRFATKPQLAARMIETAVTAGLPCRWVFKRPVPRPSLWCRP